MAFEWIPNNKLVRASAGCGEVCEFERAGSVQMDQYVSVTVSDKLLFPIFFSPRLLFQVFTLGWREKMR